MPRRHESEHRRSHRTPVSRADHKAARREEILDAAVAVLRAAGREDARLSVEEVASQLGVTRPIVYRYFGDRQGLALGVAERFASGLLASIEAALAEADLEPRDLLARTIDAYLRVVEDDANVYRYIFSEAGGLGIEQKGFVQALAGRIAIVIGERLRQVGADSGPAEPWAFALIGMAHFAGDWWIDRRTLSRERLVEYLVQLSWDGLASVADPDR